MRYFLLLILLVGCGEPNYEQAIEVHKAIKVKVKVDCVDRAYKGYCEHSFGGTRYCTRYKWSNDNHRISCDLYDALKGGL